MLPNSPATKIEKLIVDLLANNPIVFPVDPAEVQVIITTALTTYNINYSTLTRYAKKRNQYHRLKEIMSIIGEIR